MLSIALTIFYDGYSGKQLRSKLFEDTKLNHKQLGYTRGRQQLYGYVANDKDKNYVSDIYTGLQMPCDYESMNTQCNAAKDLNAEHTVPQSFFKQEEPMKSDLHALKTAWNVTNRARSNYPFEIISPENEETYYGDKKVVTDKRPSNIDDFSIRSKQNTFMTRIQQRGDTARAVAYFYVRYPDQFHSLMSTFVRIDDMIEWDMLYAPTEQQMQESVRVQEVQGNTNPFMHERNLVFRAYCDLSEGKYPCDQSDIPSGDNKNMGRIIGISIAVALVLIVIAVIIGVICCCVKKSKARKQMTTKAPMMQ